MFKFVTMSVVALTSVCLSAYAQDAVESERAEVEAVTADVAFDGSDAASEASFDAAEVASDSSSEVSSESNSDVSAE